MKIKMLYGCIFMLCVASTRLTGVVEESNITFSGRSLDVLISFVQYNYHKPISYEMALSKSSDAIGDEPEIYSFTVPRASTVEQALQAFTKVNDNFDCIKDNATLVIRPKESPLVSAKFDFNIENVSPADAYKLLNKNVLAPNKILLLTRPHIGQVAGHTLKIYESYPYISNDKMSITLKIKDASICEILDRFIEALGPDVYWSLLPTDDKGGMNLAFGRVESPGELNSKATTGGN